MTDSGRRNRGAIILTGPSSCGKGEVSKALRAELAIPAERCLAMGAILRETFAKAQSDAAFVADLEARHAISDRLPIVDTPDMTDALRAKIAEHQSSLSEMLGSRAGHRARPGDWRAATALDWLEYCASHGLLVPNRWTQSLIAARLASLAQSPGLLILDGYPRTPAAAEHLLDVLAQAQIPVVKVLHLSISKQEMLNRAALRQRDDDDHEALLKRYAFYVDSVQPSVDYMKDRLGSMCVALIDAHQPEYDSSNGRRVLNLRRSVENVVRSCLATFPAWALSSGA